MKRAWCCRDLDGESLPDIANGEMTEIRIKYTAEKCE